MRRKSIAQGLVVACLCGTALSSVAFGDVFYDTTGGLDNAVLAASPGSSYFGSDPTPHDLIYGQTVSTSTSGLLETISLGLKATVDPGPMRLFIFDVGNGNAPSAGATADYTEDFDTSGMIWNGFRQFYTFTLSTSFQMSSDRNYTIAFSSGNPNGSLRWYTAGSAATGWVKGNYSLDAGSSFTLSNATYQMQLAGSTLPVPGAGALAGLVGLGLVRRRRRR